jgi:pSer/pThr/pTyr-binding forkhead associated (FHA) protein
MSNAAIDDRTIVAPRARLIVTEDQTESETVLTPLGLTIGRDPRNGIVIHDGAASRHHARITFAGGSFSITDLGSTNGTLVNGKPIRQCTLAHQDEIVIGKALLRFQSP